MGRLRVHDRCRRRAFQRDIDRLVYVDGRPARSADEVVIDTITSSTVGLSVGDRLPAELWDPESIDFRAHSATQATSTPLRIVGVANSPRELSRLPGYFNAWASPAFDRAHRSLANFDVLRVRLSGGADAVTRFNAALHELSAVAPGVDARMGAVTESGDPEARVGAALDAIALALIAIAAAVLVTTSVAATTALLRRFARRADDLRSLHAMGANRRQRTWALAAPPLVVAMPAVLAGALGAWLASSEFPWGIASRIETRPGRSLDLVVLGPGVVALVALIALLCWLAARAAVSRAARPTRSRVRSGRISLPVGGAVATGVSFALLPSRGRVPVRTAAGRGGGRSGRGRRGAHVLLHRAIGGADAVAVRLGVGHRDERDSRQRRVGCAVLPARRAGRGSPDG